MPVVVEKNHHRNPKAPTERQQRSKNPTWASEPPKNHRKRHDMGMGIYSCWRCCKNMFKGLTLRNLPGKVGLTKM